MVSDADRLGGADVIPLSSLAELTHSQVLTLKSHWITSIDALVAAAATEGGRRGICQALNIDTGRLAGILRGACDRLGDRRYRELSDAQPGGPTGARWNDDDAPQQLERESPQLDEDS